MAVQAVTNLGQINIAGDEEALFLKVPAGQVLTTYEEVNVTKPRIFMKRMPRGAKSVQFPGVGRAKSRWHEAGSNFLTDTGTAAVSATHDGNITPSQTSATAAFLSNVNMGEREVFIDQPLKTGVFLDSWEQYKASFDALMPVSRELGRVLAVDNDKNVLRLICRAAGGTGMTGGIDWSASSLPKDLVYIAGTTTEIDGDFNYVDTSAGTDGSVLLDLIRQAAEGFDENEVPEEGRYCALAPSHYNLLVQNQDLLNRDFGGQNGIFADGTVFKAWGIELLKSNHVPTGDFSNTQGSPIGVRGTDYSANCTGTVALVWQRDGVAGVEAGSISLEKGYLMHYGGTLLLASKATGYDVLRPLHCARIATSTA